MMKFILTGSKGTLLGLLYSFSRDTENCPQRSASKSASRI